MQIVLFLTGSKKSRETLREISSMFSFFSFHLFNNEVINFLVWNYKKSKSKNSHLIVDIIIMHCKYVTESLSDLGKPTAFIAKTIIIVNERIY